jgi:hypothetical protein
MQPNLVSLPQMQIAKTLFSIFLSVLIGLVFIYSAYVKLLPVVETFEFTFVDIGIANWKTAPVLARLLIGFEFTLGVLLVSCYNLKKFTLPITALLLLVFIVYLFALLGSAGNTGNCGCFGDRIPMTPRQALIKNFVLMLLLLPVYLWLPGWTVKRNILLVAAIVPLTFGLPFIVNPVDYTYSSNNLNEVVNYPLELDLLYKPEDTSKVEIPTIELRQGKQIVAFLSLTCSHCRIAAKKFRLLKKNNPALPIFFVLNGDKSRLPEFIEDTKTDNIPHSFCLGKSFVQLSSAHLPRIYFLDNSIIVKKADYFELDQARIEAWLQGKQAP